VEKILVTFALRQEGSPFVSKLARRSVRGDLVFGRFGTIEIAVSWLGIGFANFDLFASAISEFKPDLIINSGFAGGIRSLLEAGDFVLARNYSSPELLERIGASHLFSACGNFVSLTGIAGPEAKARLSLEGNVFAIDMESDRLAAACQKSSVPFLTARMISDRADEAIPKLFLGQKIRGPDDIFRAIHFVGRMLILRKKLAARLGQLIEELTSQEISQAKRS